MKELSNGSGIYTQENLLPEPLWAKEYTAGFKLRLNGGRALELPNHPLSRYRRFRRYYKQLCTLLFLTISKRSTYDGYRTVGDQTPDECGLNGH